MYIISAGFNGYEYIYFHLRVYRGPARFSKLNISVGNDASTISVSKPEVSW